jgi:hypothetical protein
MHRVSWINTYGPTEATIYATAIAFDGATPLPDGEVPIGRPVANTQVHILDVYGNLAPAGVAGEIHIGGVQVVRGYLNRAQLTAERFVPDPFSARKGARLYRTGDLGRWLPDGTLDYLGRNDFQIKMRGFRIEPGEIEARLAASDDVAQALVLACDDAAGNKRLVAYLAAASGRQPDVDALRAGLVAVLADYMVPSAFVVLDAFPLTAHGKVDRRALPAPDGDAVRTRPFEMPSGPAEEDIAVIWQTLLGLERVGRADHFFELGGHSLLVVSLIEQLRSRGWNADVRSVFSAPTLAGLAALLAPATVEVAIADDGIPAESTMLTPAMVPLVALTQSELDGIVARVPGGVANIADVYPLSPLQAGILFHHLLETEGDTYLLRLVLSFDHRARADAFLGALQQVIDRHDILRTAVLWEGLAEPVQVVYRHAAMPVTAVAAAPGEDALMGLLRQSDPRYMRLSLQHAPLLAAHLAVDPHDGTCHVALLNHHLIGDHVTQEVIVDEIRRIMAGQAGTLAPPIPYRRFIARALRMPVQAHADYFSRLLGDVTETTAPFGLLNVQGAGAVAEEVTLDLDSAAAQRIRASARRAGVSPAVLFHVAWAAVLGKCSGRDDVVFGSVLLGRMHGGEGSDRVLGMFVNTLPVRVQLDGAGVADAVAAAQDQLTELLAHETAPLTLAQRCSGIAAPAPLFTSLLNYRHSYSDAGAQPHGAEGIHLHAHEERISYPVGLSVNDLGTGFSLTSHCAGVDPGRMAALLRHAVDNVAVALTEAPQRLLATLAVLDPSERGRWAASMTPPQILAEAC